MHYQQIRSEISNCVVNSNFEGLRNIHCNLILKKMEQNKFFSDFLTLSEDQQYFHDLDLTDDPNSKVWKEYHQKYDEYDQLSNLIAICNYYLH